MGTGAVRRDHAFLDKDPLLVDVYASGWPKFHRFSTACLMAHDQNSGLDRGMLIYSVAVSR
jgi:hypothetical protein